MGRGSARGIVTLVVVVTMAATACGGSGRPATATGPGSGTGTGTGPGSGSGTGTGPAASPLAARQCVLPPLPAPGTGGTSPNGPVVASGDGALGQPFDLDGGRLRALPPQPGDAPTVSADQAECAALAALNDNGLPLVRYAKLFGGEAVAYGRVTVAQSLVATAQMPGYLQGSDNEKTHPTLPPAAPYQSRLAWLVVVNNGGYFGGCSATPTSTTTAAAPNNDYIVFLLDARRGGDALLYIESPGPCDTRQLPPVVSVPAELVSVPWTLESRASDNLSGQIRVSVLPCDGYPYSVSPDRSRPALGVVVERPVDPSCGSPKQVTVGLHSDTPLPARIGHDPTGPYVTFPPA